MLASGPSVGLGAGMHVCASSSGVQDSLLLSLPCTALLSHCCSPSVCLWPLSCVCVSKDTCGSGGGSMGGKHEGEAKVIAAGSPGSKGDNNRPKCKRKTYRARHAQTFGEAGSQPGAFNLGRCYGLPPKGLCCRRLLGDIEFVGHFQA